MAARPSDEAQDRDVLRRDMSRERQPLYRGGVLFWLFFSLLKGQKKVTKVAMRNPITGAFQGGGGEVPICRPWAGTRAFMMTPIMMVFTL